MSNVEKLPVKARDDGPAVTLIGTDLPESYLEEAEPSPFMHSAHWWWRRGVGAIKIAGLLAVAAFYPALIAGSHDIKDDPVVLSAERPWTSPETGIMITMIGREIEGPGWASDRAGWHPQARLTGLPAWQEALSSSMSEYVRLMANRAKTPRGTADPDLSAASRLLTVDPQLEQTPRLAAAAEALARYEGRFERDLANSSGGFESLLDKMALMASWSEISVEDLGEQIALRDGWPASKDDIRAFYAARARAQLASQLIAASLNAEPDIVVSEAVQTRIDRLVAAWRRAAMLDPIFVSNQSGDARLMADHLAMMAFYIGEAGRATRDLGGAIIIETEENAQAALAGMSPSRSTSPATGSND